MSTYATGTYGAATYGGASDPATAVRYALKPGARSAPGLAPGTSAATVLSVATRTTRTLEAE